MTSSGDIFYCLSGWAGKEKMPHQKGVIDIQSTPKKEVLHLRQSYLSVPFFMALLGYFLPKILHKDAFRVRIEGNAHERPCKKPYCTGTKSASNFLSIIPSWIFVQIMFGYIYPTEQCLNLAAKIYLCYVSRLRICQLFTVLTGVISNWKSCNTPVLDWWPHLIW